jgi:hypothetical protein
MQQAYTYERMEREGQNFDPDFRPELTPGQRQALLHWAYDSRRM